MAKSEFRFNKRRKHPAYVFKEKNGKYHSLTITHSPRTNHSNNVLLYKNPNPKDSRQAYVVRRVFVDTISSYDKPKKKWNFHTYDRRNIKRLKKGKKV